MDPVDISKLTSILQVTLSPNAQNRTEAFKYCESLKENEKCASVGFCLFEQSALHSQTRYFALHLVKHSVKMHWTSLSPEDQRVIQQNTLGLIQNCPLAEPSYMKSTLASILTEIAKHVWPQQWPNMFEELVNGCVKPGNLAAIEIVVQMFLTLAEDVAILQNITIKHRAKDLRQALTLVSNDVLQLILNIMQLQLQANASPSRSRLLEVTLRAFSGYAEWVNVQVIVQNSLLIDIVFKLLTDPDVGLHAADTLLVVCSRKGKPDEKNALLGMLCSSNLANLKFIQQSTNIELMKTVGTAVASLTSMFLSVCDEWEDKSNFERYKDIFEILFLILSHSNALVSHTVIGSWCAILRSKSCCDFIRMDDHLPLLTSIIERRISVKIEVDDWFIDDDDAADFLHSYSVAISDLTKHCASYSPVFVSTKAIDLVKQMFNSCSQSNDWSMKKWDKIHAYIDAVMNTVTSSTVQKTLTGALPLAASCELMEFLLVKLSSLPTSDPLACKFISIIFSLSKLCIQSECATSICKVLFEKLFSILDEPFAKANQHSHQTKTCRELSCSTLVRMAKTYPSKLLVLFDGIRSEVAKRLNHTDTSYSPFERVSILEVLIIIAAEAGNKEMLGTIIKDAIATTHYFTSSETFSGALSSPKQFLDYCGFLASEEDGRSSNHAMTRSSFYYYTSLSSTIIQRTRSLGSSDAPAVPHICNAIDHAMTIIHVISSLWSQQIIACVPEPIQRAFGVKEGEKKNVVYLVDGKTNQTTESGVPEVKEKWQKLQNFLIHLLDTCYSIVGHAGQVLGNCFYEIPQLDKIIVAKVFSNLPSLPTFRLKALLRQFLCNFFKNCPLEYAEKISIPILDSFVRFMLTRLKPAWEEFENKENTRLGITGNENQTIQSENEPESEEIFEEQLLRLITREHFDVLVTLCVNKNPPSKVDQSNQENVDVAVGGGFNNHIAQLTDLGSLIVHSSSCEAVLFSSLMAISWHDTSTCFKATQLLWPLLKTILVKSDNVAIDSNIVTSVFEGLLRGLARHGQHDGCDAQLSSLAISVIEVFIKTHGQSFANIILKANPETNANNVMKFISSFEKTPTKKRKTIFKKLISGMVEKHVGQWFKEAQKMIALPRIDYKSARCKKEEALTPSSGSKEELGLAKLFKP